jgi:GMP synthase-like glutamine amidotransferase
MIIGIIDTDKLAPMLEAQFGCYGKQFTNLFKAVDETIAFKTYVAQDHQLPANIDECDAYLITGSKSNAYDELEWIQNLKACVLQLHQNRVPLIGICFGHQLIAHALAGETKKYQGGWAVGNKRSEVMSPQPWMVPKRDSFNLLVSHQDQVIRLPINTVVLATNDFCQYSSLLIDEHILTFQGHPEFTQSYISELIDMRQSILGVEIVDEAKLSIQQGHDGAMIAEWMINFVRYRVGK